MRQSHEPQRLFRSKALAGLAIAVVIASILTLVAGRQQPRPLWGDEGTFVAMTASLVHDGDLVFNEADATRLDEHRDDRSPTVILQKTRVGITYSKPLLYPLLSAPLFAVFGESGMVATNIITLALSLLLAWLYLRRLAGAFDSSWMLGSFVFASVVLAYLGWKMSDLVLLSMTLAGLILALGGRSLEIQGKKLTTPFGSHTAAVMGGLLLGGAISMRFTSAALAAAATLALLADKRWRRAVTVGVLTTVGFLAVSATSTLLLGTANPYKAERSSFNEDSGYPAGETLSHASERFTSRPATQSATWQPRLDVSRTSYSTLYFLFGRHTGLVFYFPVAMVLLFNILRRPDRVSLALLAGVLAIVAFYLLWMPENYFGGSTFIGNRYFLGAFPALLVASWRLPSRRGLAVAWALALVSWTSAAYSTYTVRDLDSSSQAHAHAGVFRYLPFESTAQRIDGLVDRFWAGDFVRFLDPFASTAAWSFRLDSTRPAAELMIATDWSDKPFYFAVSPSTAKVAVEVRGGSSEWTHHLPQEPPNAPGLLALPFSAPWRHHPYWWKPGQPYETQMLRFSLVNQGDEEATAVVRYAGKGRELAPLGAELFGLEPQLPTVAPPSGESVITVKVRNTSRRPWKSAGQFPVALGFRIVSGSQGHIEAQGSTKLPSNVPPGESVEIPLTIGWPVRPGAYQIAIELLREPTGALGKLGRLVLAVEDIELEESASQDNPAP